MIAVATTTKDPFAPATSVADALLFEGYLLYPYRASAVKNQVRWQFGVVQPAACVDAASGERAAVHTEVLLDVRPSATLHLRVRCLQLRHRPATPAVDEGIERAVDHVVAVDDLRAGPVELPVELPAETGETGETRAITGRLVLTATAPDGPYDVLHLQVRLENQTSSPPVGRTRDELLRDSFIATHVLLALDGGHFLSLLDPPEWARGLVRACTQDGLNPVLIGDPEQPATLLLASPIILYDFPETAPESQGDLFDATEIDEILTLRTLTLTDAEKAEARATDPRAAAIVDRVDAMPQEILDRLHGAIRSMRPVGASAPADDVITLTDDPASWTPSTDAPWWDPGADASVSPDHDTVVINGVDVRRGSRVLLTPGRRRADAQDMFLVGREAHVEAVLNDVDGQVHVAVTLRDDPGAELARAQGRFHYFTPDELEPLP